MSENNRDDDIRLQMRAKATSHFFDPCEAESKRSMKCLDENGYNKDKCQLFFQQYKDCKKKWRDIRLEERAKHGFFYKLTSKSDANKESGPSNKDESK